MCERGVSRLEVWNYIGLQYTVGAPASPRDSFRLFRVAIAQFSEVKMVQYTIRGICGSIGAVLDPFRFVVSSSAAPFTFILLLGSSPGRRVRGVPLGLGRRSGTRSDLTLRHATTRLTARTALRGAARAHRAPRTAVATSTKISNLKLAKFSHLGHRSRAPRGVTRFSVRDREFAITGRSSGRITGDTEAIAKSHRSTTTRPFVPIANAKPT